MNILKKCTFEPFHLRWRNTRGFTLHDCCVPKGHQELTLNYDQLWGFWKQQTCEQLVSSAMPHAPSPRLLDDPIKQSIIIHAHVAISVFINRKDVLQAYACTHICVYTYVCTHVCAETIIYEGQIKILDKNNSDKTEPKTFGKLIEQSLWKKR